jgi:hypothetical protein
MRGCGSGSGPVVAQAIIAELGTDMSGRRRLGPADPAHHPAGNTAQPGVELVQQCR